MPTCFLKPHPDTPTPAISEIQVSAVVDRTLRLQYLLKGDIDHVVVPPLGDAQRRDQLWRHTCCEVFVKTPTSDAYIEFNFSPSRAWAAYQFETYRTNPSDLVVAPPLITVEREAGSLHLSADVALPIIRSGSARWLHCAIACVIEAADGAISYWALHHPTGKPDFHHAEAFMLSLSLE